MQQQKNTPSRKKFLVWGLGVLSSLAAVKFMIPTNKKKNTVKMLTQDGKLVEIDRDLVSSNKKKITKEELQSWIKK